MSLAGLCSAAHPRILPSRRCAIPARLLEPGRPLAQSQMGNGAGAARGARGCGAGAEPCRCMRGGSAASPAPPVPHRLAPTACPAQPVPHSLSRRSWPRTALCRTALSRTAPGPLGAAERVLNPADVCGEGAQLVPHSPSCTACSAESVPHSLSRTAFSRTARPAQPVSCSFQPAPEQPHALNSPVLGNFSSVPCSSSPTPRSPDGSGKSHHPSACPPFPAAGNSSAAKCCPQHRPGAGPGGLGLTPGSCCAANRSQQSNLAAFVSNAAAFQGRRQTRVKTGLCQLLRDCC